MVPGLLLGHLDDSMIANLTDILGFPISPVRLEAYRAEHDSDLNMLVNYLWNIELSEALYPSLQTFEVALRNSIHTALSAHFKSEFWFDSDILLDWQQDTVQEARNQLTTYKKPHEAGRIVAELPFGFWSSMFNSPYEATLWYPNKAALLDEVFPNLPRSMRTRKKISLRVERVRRLRNRVFHYEPVWNKDDLEDRHAQIHEALFWISNEMRDILRLFDRFGIALNDKPVIEEKLGRYLGLS